MRTGIDERSFGVLTGWNHCVQSLGKILTTRINTRVCRRHLGSLVPDLQDANASSRTIFDLYVALADAIEDPTDGEPGFVLRTIELAAGGRAGRFAFILGGDFYPLGHLGDFSIRESTQAVIPVSANAGEVNLVEVTA